MRVVDFQRDTDAVYGPSYFGSEFAVASEEAQLHLMATYYF
jgi:hypothetical protein